MNLIPPILFHKPKLIIRRVILMENSRVISAEVFRWTLNLEHIFMTPGKRFLAKTCTCILDFRLRQTKFIKVKTMEYQDWHQVQISTYSLSRKGIHSSEIKFSPGLDSSLSFSGATINTASRWFSVLLINDSQLRTLRGIAQVLHAYQESSTLQIHHALTETLTQRIDCDSNITAIRTTRLILYDL